MSFAEVHLGCSHTCHKCLRPHPGQNLGSFGEVCFYTGEFSPNHKLIAKTINDRYVIIVYLTIMGWQFTVKSSLKYSSFKGLITGIVTAVVTGY